MTDPSARADTADRLRQVEADLAAVRAALDRVEDGSYGRCQACGGEIGDEILGHEPVATLCARCGGAGSD